MSITPDNLGRGPLIMGLTWSFAVLATIAVGLRFYIRIELNNRPSLDDWLIAVALVSYNRLFSHITYLCHAETFITIFRSSILSLSRL